MNNDLSFRFDPRIEGIPSKLEPFKNKSEDNSRLTSDELLI